ncbi:prepilin peptidase [Tundrisphaera lichenicola]|uniref:prepilin peptidase n=1 Tax=Tundrisphaera lichenicola TaxID=2029860 RepID=UPI003EBFC6EE
MSYLWPIHLIYGIGLFVVGTVVGSFLNVCIYRIPWEKSVIWPDSRCPKCLAAIETRDNIPILGWLMLRGSCRSCGVAIPARYALVELLVGVLFVCVYVSDGMFPYLFSSDYVRDDMTLAIKVLYHALLVSFLIAVTFIDADLMIVPASITNLGILLGLAIGTAFPGVRPAPSMATTYWGGLGVGLLGMAVGGGIIWVIRTLGTIAFRREAMGSGDIHILAMIGAFLGWEAAVVTPFLAAFVGLVPALWKFASYLAKRLAGRKYNSTDREMPFGPYLSIAALILLLAWPWAWPRALQPHFNIASEIFWFLLGRDEGR